MATPKPSERRFNSSPAAMADGTAPPRPTMSTAASWALPENTRTEKPDVCHRARPALAPATPKAMPKGITARATDNP